jgi:Trypsin-like peptidase domain
MVKLNFNSDKTNYFETPEIFAAALAHVMKIEGSEEKILGQCWLAGPGHLITCGHVVEPYLSHPEGLTVRFPDSGNRYSINSIKLHPSFVRQADQLVKFDAAILHANLLSPERDAAPMPIAYGRPLRSNEPIWTVRFPVHLGTLSAAPSPLAQEGSLLGPLRKFDDFHLLHDLALAPGDSGAPILEGNIVVGMHCGDTASLPGLNLPTTSIRLALWVDALRELGIAETASFPQAVPAGGHAFMGVACFLVALCIAFAATTATFFLTDESLRGHVSLRGKPSIPPVELNWQNSAEDASKSDLIVKSAPKYKLMLFALKGDDAETLLPSKFLSQDAEDGMLVKIASADLASWHSQQAKILILALRSDVPFSLQALGAKEIKSDVFALPKSALSKSIEDMESSNNRGVLAYSIDLKDSPTAESGAPM